MKKRPVLALAAIAMTIASVVAVVAPANATLITGSGTSFEIHTQGGESPQGQHESYDTSSAYFNAEATPDGRVVMAGVNAVVGDTTHAWWMSFAAPVGQRLTVGTTYDGLTVGGDPDRATFLLYGYDGICYPETSAFTVTSAKLDPSGWVESFAATFQMDCGVLTQAVVGSIVIENGPAPTPLVVTVVTKSPAVIDKTGMATINATITCNRDVSVGLGGRVDQRSTGKRPALGQWVVQNLPCSTTPLAFSVTTTPATGYTGLRVGDAVTSANWSAYDVRTDTYTQGTYQQNIKLVRH